MTGEMNKARTGKKEVILPAAELGQADKAVAVARRMETEAMRFAITYMRAYQHGFQSGLECARMGIGGG